MSYRFVNFHIKTVVDKEFLTANIGQVCSFPYQIHFKSERVKNVISAFRKTKKDWTENNLGGTQSALAKVQNGVLDLIMLVNPFSKKPLNVDEAVLLACSLLVLMGNYDEAIALEKAAPQAKDSEWRRERSHLRLLAAFRKLMASPPDQPEDYIQVSPNMEYDEFRNDPRIRNHMLTLRAAYEWTNGPESSARRAEEIVRDFDILTNSFGHTSKWPWDLRVKSDDLEFRIWNNFTYTLIELGSKYNHHDWITKAHDMAKTHLIRSIRSFPPDVQHTAARAIDAFAVFVADDNEKEALLKKAYEIYNSITDQAKLLDIAGSARIKKITKDKKACWENLQVILRKNKS